MDMRKRNLKVMHSYFSCMIFLLQLRKNFSSRNLCNEYQEVANER